MTTTPTTTPILAIWVKGKRTKTKKSDKREREKEIFFKTYEGVNCDLSHNFKNRIGYQPDQAMVSWVEL